MEINHDDNLVLQNYVDNFFTNVKIEDRKVEFIVRPECNQKCEYCYIYQHGKELYPIEKRQDNKTILNNINMFFDYLYRNKIEIAHWDIFAGDLFYDGLWFNLMDLFEAHYARMREAELNRGEIVIMMPCNFSFCHSNEKIAKVREYVKKFKEQHIVILFSYSSDGKYSTDLREKQELSDEYYDKVFSLMAENWWGGHPMISYEGIDNAIKNYDWWREQYKKYIIPVHPHEFMPGFLEVRNDGWTPDAIQKYLKLLEHMIWDRFAMCHYNKNEFMKHLFFNIEYQHEHGILPQHGLDPISLKYSPKNENTMTCAISHIFVVNCEDLSIVPCHRLTYNFFTGGRFTIENNQITGVEATQGLNGFFNQVTANISFNMKCYNCENRYFCMQGCRGAQFEYNQETFLPIPSVCNLLKAKYDFLVKTYHELGIFHELFSEQDGCLEEGFKRELLKLLRAKGYPEYEYKYGIS